MFETSITLSAHPFKDAADGDGHQRAWVLHQQVKHHRQQLLLYSLVLNSGEEGFCDLQRNTVSAILSWF